MDDIIAQDIEYLKKERPNHTEKQDTHESIVREYILGDSLPGSRQLKEVRDMLISTLLSPKSGEEAEWMLEPFEVLIKDWEANHPGSYFMSGISSQEAAA